MTSKQQFFSIVVLGAMNPRIHHPAWYELTGMLSAEQVNEAITSNDFLVSQPISQFRTPTFGIVCQEGRWEIQTSMDEVRSQMLDIASTVFDKYLSHTPISAFGFNFNFVHDTAQADIAEYLGNLMNDQFFHLEDEGKKSAQLTYAVATGLSRRQVQVQPVQDDAGAVAVANNFEYQINEQGFFTIGEKMAGQFWDDYTKAVQQTQHLLKVFNS